MNAQLKEFFPEDYAVYDLETSGLDPDADRILEVGLLIVREREATLRAGWIINPHYPFSNFEISPEITTITGLTHSEVSFGKKPEAVLKQVLRLLNTLTIFTHNGINFDHKFIVSECDRCGLIPPSLDRYVDTAAIFKAWKLERLDEVRRPFYEFANDILSTRVHGLKFNLLHCCNEFNIGTNDITAHRARGDVVMTYRLIEAIRDAWWGD